MGDRRRAEKASVTMKCYGFFGEAKKNQAKTLFIRIIVVLEVTNEVSVVEVSDYTLKEKNISFL
ncbi:CLUMA_CG000258, isoform A [Clunio marinus]|uniref:CLUMA_CG000258, isoform A n=1 Tax=Clunio marinus TaxID=568069 RepID=A0A1J1HEN0_9DIPT|nr:CLUMA_CG000258, isoform A [Clunio marinus]